MKKEALQPNWWPKIEQELKGGAITNLSPRVKELLSGSGKIVYEPSPPADGAEARAYVTTEDTDHNGKIDTVHMVVTNIEKDIPDLKTDFHELESDDPRLQGILSSIVGVLEHEAEHIHAHDRGEIEGSEPAAQAVQRAWTPQFRATAKTIGGENKLAAIGEEKLNLIRRLAKLANDLDKSGLTKIADEIDAIIVKESGENTYDNPENTYDNPENIIESLKGIEKVPTENEENPVNKVSASVDTGITTLGNLFKSTGLVRR